MWFRKTKPTPGLTEELVQRVWDLSGNLKQLEAVLDERLTELSSRYRRAEQSEKRLAEKRASTPCDDEGDSTGVRLGLRARQAQRARQNNRIEEKV